MRKTFLFLLMTILLMLSACSSGKVTKNADHTNKEQGEELNLAFSTWVGYAPFYIAEKKGFFKKNGVKVNLTRVENTSDRLSAMVANRIQAVGGTVDSYVTAASKGIDFVQVLPTEDSNGGDGIIAKKEFNSLQDLKGKKVAVQTDGGASLFWFNYLLQKEGMTMDDFDIQSMSSGDAGSAFVANKVDAAITWEPWLTNAKNTDFGKVLMTSEETPGIITGTIAMRKDYVADNPKQVQAFVDSWFEAVEFYKNNEDEAITIMAEALGQTDKEFKESIKGVSWYDHKKAAEFFGTKENTGQLLELLKAASDIWLEQGIIEKEPKVEELVDYSFIK